VQKRLTRYHALVRQLEKINERARKTTEEAEIAETRPITETRPMAETRTLAETRRVPRPVDSLKETAPLVYKNPFPPGHNKPQPQRRTSEADGTNTDNT
jgi:hypothetical protein